MKAINKRGLTWAICHWNMVVSQNGIFVDFNHLPLVPKSMESQCCAAAFYWCCYNPSVRRHSCKRERKKTQKIWDICSKNTYTPRHLSNTVTRTVLILDKTNWFRDGDFLQDGKMIREKYPWIICCDNQSNSKTDSAYMHIKRKNNGAILSLQLPIYLLMLSMAPRGRRIHALHSEHYFSY